jgi:hypothetical protein
MPSSQIDNLSLKSGFPGRYPGTNENESGDKSP